ncbi:hypothetical protein dsx2_0259 [Desulfovibrio sp. X2]|uniref:hypothetical protein n=1 Tax=Desulfovibrio sp. X2 TaxID=941449 RepID=UPI000358D2B3|nr:hypothetical protein [Desulfovibrio sp. X2]EPR42332.1 hypothetical protein dsx2_0259 [Desulfovibrio sp. X2]
MAHYLALPDSFPLEEQLKTLRDDELLDFWEETQHLEKLLAEEAPEAENTDYERLILQELQVRFQRRHGLPR